MKLIYEKSQTGRRACAIPRPEGLPPAEVPEELRRAEAPRLPEVPEFELVRHFTELSTRNYGIDTGFYPLGSCTMKYNPRINERLIGLPGFAQLHPHQEEDGAQGALDLGCSQFRHEAIVNPEAGRGHGKTRYRWTQPAGRRLGARRRPLWIHSRQTIQNASQTILRDIFELP